MVTGILVAQVRDLFLLLLLLFSAIIYDLPNFYRLQCVLALHFFFPYPQVANIVGRTELLSAIFFLLSLLSYHHCLNRTRQINCGNHLFKKKSLEVMPMNSDTTPSTHYSLPWLICSVLLGAVSMLYKEQGITVLGVCVCYDLFITSGMDVWEICTAFKLAAKVLITMGDNYLSKKR